MTQEIVGSIAAEFRRYKALAEGAMRQLRDEALARRSQATDNSIATIAWHVAGNLHSRFTDFLTSDGEKPWRDRESEFEPREVGRDELLAWWEQGWQAVLETLDGLGDDDLSRMVAIRGVRFRVHEALHRSLAHTSYHVGQIVYLGKMLLADSWEYLSIAPGGTEAYNQSPTREKALEHADRVARSAAGGAASTSS